MLAGVFFPFLVYGETDGMRLYPAGNDAVHTVERAAADEEDVLRIHLDELLLGVFSAALWGNEHFGAFRQLEQALLHALAAHIAGDGEVIALARDLVDLI